MYGYNITYPLGITIIGILSLITALFYIVGLCAYLIYFEQLWSDLCAKIYLDLTHPTAMLGRLQTCIEFKPFTIKISATAIVYLFLFMVCSCVLILGGIKKVKALMFPYQIALLVLTLLTILLCAYIARYLPQEFKVVIAFVCAFKAIITMSCYFFVGRHIEQLNMAEMILLASNVKLDDSFMSSAEGRSVTGRGKNQFKVPLAKLPQIKEQDEPPMKTLDNNYKNERTTSGNIFTVEQSTNNNCSPEEPSYPAVIARSDQQNTYQPSLLSRKSIPKSATIPPFKSVRKSKATKAKQINLKSHTANNTIIQGMVFKQNAI